MGANAQTTVPTFTAGQVLTADQQNQSARTGVPVFATTTTRDAGFGGTGEKTLAEGQMCYVEGTGFQTYNGSAWVTWGTTPTSGLNLVKTQTIGSSVSSVEITSAFSATYANYRIVLSSGGGSTTDAVNLRLGSTATGYAYFVIQGIMGTAGILTSTSSSATSMVGAGLFNATDMNMVCDIFSPQLAKRTIVTATSSTTVTTSVVGWLNGFLDNTTQYTSFTLLANSGTFSDGIVRVYGYQNS